MRRLVTKYCIVSAIPAIFEASVSLSFFFLLYFCLDAQNPKTLLERTSKVCKMIEYLAEKNYTSTLLTRDSITQIRIREHHFITNAQSVSLVCFLYRFMKCYVTFSNIPCYRRNDNGLLSCYLFLPFKVTYLVY